MTMRKKNATQVKTADFSDFGYEYTPKNPAKDSNYGVSRDRVNPLVAGLEKVSNVTVTENMAKAYKSTMDHLLDFFGNAGAMRKRSEPDIVQLFSKAFAEDRLLALKALFYIRDVRGGQGERRTFKVCMKWIAENYPDIFIKNIPNVPLFGRFDDLYCVF